VSRVFVLVLLLGLGAACENPAVEGAREVSRQALACMSACGASGSTYSAEYDWNGRLVTAVCVCTEVPL
jgi:hypothetical protein